MLLLLVVVVVVLWIGKRVSGWLLEEMNFEARCMA